MRRVVAGQQPSATMPAIITASWVADDDNSFNLSTPVQLWRTDQPAGPWEAQGAPGGASTCGFTASVTRLDTLTVSNTNASLPVTLLSFTAERLGNDGQRAWATASELRNDYFGVESSVTARLKRPPFSAITTR